MMLLCTSWVICSAQVPPVPAPAPSKPYTISGSVVNALTGEPVPRALVTIGEHALLFDAVPGSIGAPARRCASRNQAVELQRRNG